MVGLVMGGFVMLLGLVPSLFSGMVDGVRRFGGALQGLDPRFQPSGEPVYPPKWLPAVGLLLIVLTLWNA